MPQPHQQHLQFIHLIPVDEFKRQAKRLREHLTRAGLPLKHTQALHALAAQWGFPNWQTLEALHQQEAATPRQEPAVPPQAIAQLRRALHRIVPSDEPGDDRLERSRAQVLELRLEHPVGDGSEVLAQIVGGLGVPGALAESALPWVEVAGQLALVIERASGPDDDPFDQMDRYLLAIADLMLKERFKQVAEIVMTLEPLRHMTSLLLKQVDAVFSNDGFFGSVSEGLRLTFCRHYGLALQVARVSGPSRG